MRGGLCPLEVKQRPLTVFKGSSAATGPKAGIWAETAEHRNKQECPACCVLLTVDLGLLLCIDGISALSYGKRSKTPLHERPRCRTHGPIARDLPGVSGLTSPTISRKPDDKVFSSFVTPFMFWYYSPSVFCHIWRAFSALIQRPPRRRETRIKQPIPSHRLGRFCRVCSLCPHLAH